MSPYLMLTACAACGLLLCAQDVAAAPMPSSVRRSLRLADHLGPAGQPSAQEPHGCDDLASPEVHAVGCRCRTRMIMRPSSGDWPVLSTSRRAVKLLRRACPGHGPCTMIVSRAAELMSAHAKRRREHPRSGSSVRWSGTDFAEFLGPPQIS